MSASEEFPEYLVKFRPDHGKFLRELLPHSDIQLLDDLIEGILCRNKIIMLGLHKLVALRNFLVVLDGVDVDISETSDRVFPLSDLSFHVRHIVKRSVSQELRRRECETIFIPHIVHLRILSFCQFVALVLETEKFFVQVGDPRGERFPLLKETLLGLILCRFFFLRGSHLLVVGFRVFSGILNLLL